MYKVIGSPKTRTMRVLWMLEELGQDYEIQPAKPHSAEVLPDNPGGKIPVLQDDGATLRDSVAICTYLADKHGRLTCPAGTTDRARQDALTQFCVDEVEGALWTAAKNTFVNPEEHRAEAVIPVAKFEFAKAMTTLEKHLENRDFVCGESFTVPDLLLGHCAGWAKNAGFPIPDGAVAAYLERMRARPALARAMERAEHAIQAA